MNRDRAGHFSRVEVAAEGDARRRGGSLPREAGNAARGYCRRVSDGIVRSIELHVRPGDAEAVNGGAIVLDIEVVSRRSAHRERGWLEGVVYRRYIAGSG